jgi:acetyltransferase-like isoleucine patch superfamily enzyme
MKIRGLLRKIISLLIRKPCIILDKFRNKIVIAYLMLKYPDCKISFNSYLEKGCQIICTSGSKLKIKNSIISKGTYILADHGGTIEIEDTFIGRNGFIMARKKITIAANCQIAEMVVIRDQNHNFGKLDLTIAEQGFTVSSITICENVWLAAKSTVLAGSVIGNNTVVGANAVVRGKLDCNSVYVGVPVKKVNIQS